MAKEKNKNQIEFNLFHLTLLIIVLIEGLLWGYVIGYNRYNDNYNIPEERDSKLKEIEIIIRDKATFKRTYENLYDVEYWRDGDDYNIKITHPCVKIKEAHGISMLPFWERDNLVLIDTCFNASELRINDVIVFYAEKSLELTQHRIIDIDYEKEWVRTQGDNNNYKDDFKAFEYIYGKVIGFLNTEEDKIEVLEKINDTENISIGVEV